MSFPALGAVLAQGAPLGLLALRCALARAWPTPPWVAHELSRDLMTYAYLALSTTVVFTLLGRALGGQADRLEGTSTTDALSGLANRRRFDDRLRDDLALADRHGTTVALLLVDVDGLKRINDEGGHAAGDLALRAVASALRLSSRRSDLAARTGGDEFAVIAPLTTAEQAMDLACRIRATLATLPPHLRPTTVSIGIADTGESGAQPLALYALADRALYAAKAAGGDRACTLEVSAASSGAPS
jgi:diguanylate cyclase (GGDEF)-like protein